MEIGWFQFSKAVDLIIFWQLSALASCTD